jgi:oligoribonuclease NrnB/cAMP/cGMP phosphodiesterase (DHH superfamily)
MRTAEKIVGIYHKDCIDGTGAAAVLLRKFPTAQLFPLRHAYTQDDIRHIMDLLDPDTHCYTLDCGLTIKECLAAGSKVTTIDHHIGVKETFEKLAQEETRYTYVFDNEKCGTSLSWSFFFPDEKQPEVIAYIEDSDLWRGAHGKDTGYVNGYLSMFRNNPGAMLQLIEKSIADMDEIKRKGEIIATYSDKEVEMQAATPPIDLKIGAHVVPAYNVTFHESAVGNMLSEKLNGAVALFTMRGKKVKFSFRSKAHHAPTSLELAELLGGGGHKNAAGAEIPLEQFLSMIV